MRKILTAAAVLLSCGHVYAQSGKSDPEISAAGWAAIFKAVKVKPDAKGNVQNDCGEKVEPKIVSADVGGSVGVAQLLVIPGGPNTATCYGDGPGDLTLLARDAKGYRVIFRDRGYIAILPKAHRGVHDIALGGPGFSFPVFEWNGKQYVIGKRMISDAEFAKSPMLP